MERILSRPHEQLTQKQIDRPIWMMDAINGAIITDLISRPADLILIPQASTLAVAAFPTSAGLVLPSRVRLRRAVPSTDTPENRFIATVVDVCLSVVRTVETYAARETAPAMKPLQAEAHRLAISIERWRRHRVLEELQPVDRISIISTVLRGRPGYRDVLRFYGDLIGRTQLIPAGALRRIVGLRDMAHLYEWWCFFQVVAAVSETMGEPLHIDQPTRTWQGAELGEGLTASFPDGIRVEFNRRFSRSAPDAYHSYSVPLRPDILLVTRAHQARLRREVRLRPRASQP